MDETPLTADVLIAALVAMWPLLAILVVAAFMALHQGMKR